MTWGIVHMYDPRFTNLWDYLVTEAQIPMSWIYPDFGGNNGNVDEPWRTHINCVNELPGPFVVLSPEDGHNVKGEHSLYTFSHPKNCYYLFGSDRHNMSLDDDAIKLHEREDITTVYIPDIGKSMYSVECAAMVMYDRRFKQWQL